jgi:hypothetical protein
MTVFIDGIVLTRKFKEGSIPELCGMRSMAYLQPGDVDKQGNKVVELTALGDRLYTAWIQGSHDSKLQMASDGTTLSLKGNPGRFGRRDNLFNLDFEQTIAAANRIAAAQGFPADSFVAGRISPYTVSQLQKMNLAEDEVPEQPYEVEKDGVITSGARVWSVHMTQNYRTGSPENAKAVIDWANTQTMARVKKARLGSTTLIWGSISYCQTELYDKAEEMLAHAKGPKERERVLLSEAYQYAKKEGIIRLEVKCAKDFLKHRKLTYLGNWSMGTVTQIFKEKAEILDRCKAVKCKEDEDILAHLPSSTRVHAAAWLAGVDVAAHMSRRTFFRHAKVLREYGIDIAEKRNVAVIQPKMREIEITPVSVPDWYSLRVA